MQLCGSLSILWHCLSLGLEWKLTFYSSVATVKFSKFAGQMYIVSIIIFIWGLTSKAGRNTSSPSLFDFLSISCRVMERSQKLMRGIIWKDSHRFGWLSFKPCMNPLKVQWLLWIMLGMDKALLKLRAPCLGSPSLVLLHSHYPLSPVPSQVPATKE